MHRLAIPQEFAKNFAFCFELYPICCHAKIGGTSTIKAKKTRLLL